MGISDPVAAQEKDSRKYQYDGGAKAYRKLGAIPFREIADLEMTQRREPHDHEGIDGHHASTEPVIRQALDRGIDYGQLRDKPQARVEEEKKRCCGIRCKRKQDQAQDENEVASEDEPRGLDLSGKGGYKDHGDHGADTGCGIKVPEDCGIGMKDILGYNWKH